MLYLQTDNNFMVPFIDGISPYFVLSYNDCEYIRELYEGYHIIEVERIHNLVMKERKPKYKELIIYMLYLQTDNNFMVPFIDGISPYSGQL